MRAVSVESKGIRGDGKEIVEAVILADTTPEPLPTSGLGVDGMTDDQVFAPFSLLYVVADETNKVYIANEAGAFVAQ